MNEEIKVLPLSEQFDAMESASRLDLTTITRDKKKIKKKKH